MVIITQIPIWHIKSIDTIVEGFLSTVKKNEVVDDNDDNDNDNDDGVLSFMDIFTLF